MAAVAFFVGSAVFVVRGGTPPSVTSIAPILDHVGWFIAGAFLAIGAVALFRRIEPLGTGLAGYVAVGTLTLGVLIGVQWVVLAWIDVLAAGHENYELLLGALISIMGHVPEASGRPFYGKEVTLRVLRMDNHPVRTPVLEGLGHLLQRGDLTGLVVETYDLDEVAQAHRDVLTGGYVGKHVVTP